MPASRIFDRRGAKQLNTRLRRANFEHRKSLEDFDFIPRPPASAQDWRQPRGGPLIAADIVTLEQHAVALADPGMVPGCEASPSFYG
jgi:hypothetical protein